MLFDNVLKWYYNWNRCPRFNNNQLKFWSYGVNAVSFISVNYYFIGCIRWWGRNSSVVRLWRSSMEGGEYSLFYPASASWYVTFWITQLLYIYIYTHTKFLLYPWTSHCAILLVSFKGKWNVVCSLVWQLFFIFLLLFGASFDLQFCFFFS